MIHEDGVPAKVTITSYSIPAVIHVQGFLHSVWVYALLDTIEQEVKHKLQINEPQPQNQSSEHVLFLLIHPNHLVLPTSGFDTHTEI